MGKKKQQHVQQSMSQLVSQAALSQLKPHIDFQVKTEITRLGNKLARQQLDTL